MQQTENYKLNLIETSDPFGPETLNENARKLDTELARVEAQREARLDEIVQGQLQFTTGSYTGTGGHGQNSPNRIEFPFKPLLVFICSNQKMMHYTAPWIRGLTKPRGIFDHTGTTYFPPVAMFLTWEDKAISFWHPNLDEYQMNTKDTEYTYFALGVLED